MQKPYPANSFPLTHSIPPTFFHAKTVFRKHCLMQKPSPAKTIRLFLILFCFLKLMFIIGGGLPPLNKLHVSQTCTNEYVGTIKKVFRWFNSSCIAMPGPSDADLARAVARERVRLRCQIIIDSELPWFELCRRRLQLAGLHVRKQRLDGNYAASSSHLSLEISCSSS